MNAHIKLSTIASYMQVILLPDCWSHLSCTVFGRLHIGISAYANDTVRIVEDCVYFLYGRKKTTFKNIIWWGNYISIHYVVVLAFCGMQALQKVVFSMWIVKVECMVEWRQWVECSCASLPLKYLVPLWRLETKFGLPAFKCWPLKIILHTRRKKEKRKKDWKCSCSAKPTFPLIFFFFFPCMKAPQRVVFPFD